MTARPFSLMATAKALGKVANVCESTVIVHWRTPDLVSASAADGDSTHEVRWSSFSGWACSCLLDDCAHVTAVRSITSKKGQP